MSVPDIAGEDEKDKSTTWIFKCTRILLEFLVNVACWRCAKHRAVAVS